MHFLQVLGKVFRSNAAPATLSNTPSQYFLQYHQRFSLYYAIHATHVNTLPTLPTLAHHPRHPCWHVTHASTPSTLACHLHQCATNANTPPTLAGLPDKHTTYDTKVSTISMPFLKLLGIQLALKFQEVFSSFYFQFLFLQPLLFVPSFYFYRNLQNCHTKIKLFQRKLICLIQKTTIFSKIIAQIFQKRLSQHQCRSDHFVSLKFGKIVYQKLIV